jgi:hypothetical protein
VAERLNGEAELLEEALLVEVATQRSDPLSVHLDEVGTRKSDGLSQWRSPGQRPGVRPAHQPLCGHPPVADARLAHEVE